jgi:adenine deaminase
MGAAPLAVYRAASLSAAEAFGLKDRGLIAPGKRADIVVIDSLEGCHAALVLAAGVVAMMRPLRGGPRPSRWRGSVKAPPVEAGQFRTGGNRVETPVIGILPGKIITEHLTFDIAPQDGDKRPMWRARDLVKIAVIERHGVNGNRATGFVKGLRVAAGGDRIDRLPRPPQHRGGGGGLCRHGAGGEPAGGDRGRVRGGGGGPGAGRTGAAGRGADESGELRGGARGAGQAARRRRSLGVVLEEPFLQLAFLACR